MGFSPVPTTNKQDIIHSEVTTQSRSNPPPSLRRSQLPRETFHFSLLNNQSETRILKTANQTTPREQILLLFSEFH